MSSVTLESSLLTVEEAARLIHLKPSTVRDWILKRRIPFVKLGRRVFIRRSDVEALIENSVVPAAAFVRTEKVA
jgi:excisionase family DNA binding protein